MSENETCPLCHAESTVFRAYAKKTFLECGICRGIFLPKIHHLDYEAEKARYDLHDNDVENLDYQKFVSPLVQAVLRDFTPFHKGLDFGAGPGPVITKLLRENDFDIIEYDPYYWDNPELLNEVYDYIVCCEVMEHFNTPDKSFQLLKKILKSKGKLYCMTSLYKEDINFDTWFYKNDVTHVFFYREETLQWIQQRFGFSSVELDGKAIIFSND